MCCEDTRLDLVMIGFRDIERVKLVGKLFAIQIRKFIGNFERYRKELTVILSYR